MKIYMAAVHTNGYWHGGRFQALNLHEQKIIETLPHLLESYHYIKKPVLTKAIHDKGDVVFLDSGAFSAYTSGQPINLTDYCDFIKRNEDIIEKNGGLLMASVLDVIGDAQGTYEAQLQMEALGIRPLPCFHFGDDVRYLEWYMENYDYITIGGLVPESTKTCIKWLNRIWSEYLTDDAGRPKVKVHAFGVSNMTLMNMYPWTSCDSASWIQSASFGKIVTSEFGILAISDKSPTLHVRGQHVLNKTDIEKEMIFESLESDGFNYERLSTSYESRAAYNLKSFQKISADFTAKNKGIFILHQPELF